MKKKRLHPRRKSTWSQAIRLNSNCDTLERVIASSRNAGGANARIHEMDSWQCILQLHAFKNAPKPFPMNYFIQLTINAVNEAWVSGIKTVEERQASVMAALVEKEIKYSELLARALKFARRDLPMGLIPSKDHKALVAEAVYDAIEERFLAYIFADGEIRKFYDILWPVIKPKLAEALHCECDPIDEHVYIAWLTKRETWENRCQKTNSSRLIHESSEANKRSKR